MRRAVLAFFATGLRAPAPTTAGDAVRYSWEKEIYVPMRDGVRLSTDVLSPAEGDGPFPTVLVRTPYHKDNTGSWAGRPTSVSLPTAMRW